MDIVPYATVEQIEAALHGLALLAGAIAFACGLFQYAKAQTWRRHEFVAAEVQRFESDLQVRNAMLMIDWGTRSIELFPSHPDYSSRFLLVTRPALHTALTTHDKIGRAFTPAEGVIRDCFDSFFGGLERFDQFMEARLVSPAEFRPYLNYWLREICVEANPELRRVLSEYVAFYHFDGVACLFRRYGKEFGLRDPANSVSMRHDVENRYEEQLRNELAASRAREP